MQYPSCKAWGMLRSFMLLQRPPLGNQAVDRFIRRPDLEWLHPHSRVYRDQRDRVIPVAGFQQQNAAERIVGLPTRTNGGFALAILPPL
ncbi:hypothetical protein SAMN05444166_7648 [Singulisphaera sp. GP187]|uniref:hypothetical protein n=1 Tax=Singulisphaera sp. GP187 TaxID=1882752 RepID=UPI00092C80DA|nr:hypothetical protein [Singulisphaera sp. GP187]SIO65284.1 hypothetical protein SAMN05444166_7648 [Singulisphaera sp. GP187]